MIEESGTSPLVHCVFRLIQNRTNLPLRQEAEGNLGPIFKAFVIDGYSGTAKWAMKIRPKESYSRKNVYCISKGINQSGPNCVKSLNSQGVKAFNSVSIKATEVRKEDNSSEVTTSHVSRNCTEEMVPRNSPGLQRD